jgi:hypothetical protein
MRKMMGYRLAASAMQTSIASDAKTSGLDLKAEMEKVYRSGKHVDEDALARVFKFSIKFETLDSNARAYGQIIYSSLLNIGEVIGVPVYTKIIDRQPPEVQQRIRDFLYYGDWKAHRDEARKLYEKAYPGLYPKEYQFGRNDPIFAKET